MSDIVFDKLRDHISLYIKKTDWYNFIYTWFLTCLYHDTAAVIEKYEYNCNSPKELDFYLDRYNIEYNVYDHMWENNKPYTYPETLVKNYFSYRAEYWQAIDHGIIAGYLLYDKLKKNYNTNWEKVKSHHRNYNNFNYKNLQWKIEHLSHFAYVANAIIAHNIWYSEKNKESKSIYKQYGLNPLVYCETNMISLHKDPLVFYLGLLDTIEPVKFFIPECDINSIWKAIQIEYNCTSCTLNIKTDGSLLKNSEWFKKIRGMDSWLDVSIYEPEADREINITIK